MSSQYMLIEVIEREISEPEFFKNLEAAQQGMLDRIAEALQVDKNLEYEEKLTAVQEADGYVHETFAYCEKHGQNFDWKIFKI